MRVIVALALGLAGLLAALPAQALTLANHDPDAHKVTVKTDSKTTELTVNPNATVDAPCDPVCVIDLDGEEYQMQSRDQASIENGLLFLDSAPDASDADPDDAGAIPDDPDGEDSASAPPD